MSFLSSFEISGSALTAQRLRMDTVAENLANQDVTQTAQGGPYSRKSVVLEQQKGGQSFGKILGNTAGGGVHVKEIIEDTSNYKVEYNPTHPDADAKGYVRMSNVDTTTEMMEMMSANRSYSANVTVINATKLMASKALEIGR